MMVFCGQFMVMITFKLPVFTDELSRFPLAQIGDVGNWLGVPTGEGVGGLWAGKGMNGIETGRGVGGIRIGDGVNDLRIGDGVNGVRTGDGVNGARIGNGVGNAVSVNVIVAIYFYIFTSINWY